VDSGRVVAGRKITAQIGPLGVTSGLPVIWSGKADGPSFLAAMAQALAGLGKNPEKHPSTFLAACS